MKQEEKFKIVEKEVKKHIKVFVWESDKAYIQSALEEFFWGTYDLFKKKVRKK